MIQRDLGRRSLVTTWYESVQVKSLGNCAFVHQELYLLQVYDIGELEDQLLWVGTKLCTFPSMIDLAYLTE